MEEHWRAGYEDTMVALNEPAIFELPDVSETSFHHHGLTHKIPDSPSRIFDVHHGWLK
jgi:hypothetical protein